jgi:hypothetical protein
MEKDPNLATGRAKRVLRYLAGTKDVGLRYKNKEFLDVHDDKQVEAYTDASFAPRGAHSQGAMVVTYHGMPVFWKTGKQAFITLSTAESELMEATNALTALRSVGTVVEEMKGGLEGEERMKLKLHVDNSAAIAIASPTSAFHWRTRHLKVRAAALAEAIDTNEVTIHHVPGIRQLADIGTKTLPSTTLRSLMFLMNMIDGDSQDEYVKRLEQPVKIRMLKVREVEVEGKWFMAAIILFTALIGCAVINFARAVRETIDEVQRYVRGKPTKLEETMTRMNETAEKIQRIEQVRNLEIPEDQEVWEVITPLEGSDADDRKETKKEQRKVKVRTVKVQGPVTCKGHGPMQPLAERVSGVSEEILEEKTQTPEDKERKTLTTQTEVTYQFWTKNPRYEKRF